METISFFFNVQRLIARFRRNYRLEMLVAAMVSIAALSSLPLVYSRSGDPELIAFDVGQGDAILIKSSFGRTMLIDGGPDDRILGLLGAELGPFERSLDLVVLTHPHADHVVGLLSVMKRYAVASLMWTGVDYPSPLVEEFQESLSGVPLSRRWIAQAGQTIVLDDIRFRVLWPAHSLAGLPVPPEQEEGNGGANDTSIVLEGWVGSSRVLLAGDISSSVERQILASTPLGSVDFLKVGHHGSRFSTGQQWVEVLQPKVAVLSFGSGNTFNHPAQSVIHRLEERGAQVFQTGVQGTIRLRFTGNGAFTASTSR